MVIFGWNGNFSLSPSLLPSRESTIYPFPYSSERVLLVLEDFILIFFFPPAFLMVYTYVTLLQEKQSTED